MSYGVVTIYNPMNFAVNFSIQTRSGGGWSSFTLSPGTNNYYYQEGEASFAIKFDYSFKPGYQERSYGLPHGTAWSHPSNSVGREYVFHSTDEGVDLATLNGNLTDWIAFEAQKAAERLQAWQEAEYRRQQEELRKQEEARRREEERLRPAREAVVQGRQAADEKKYDVALKKFKEALRLASDNQQLRSQINDLIKVTDQHLRNQQACTKSRDTAREFADKKQWAIAIYHLEYAHAYCQDDRAFIEGLLEQARKMETTATQSVAVNDAGRTLEDQSDFVAAYYKYKEAIAMSKGSLTKANESKVNENLYRVLMKCNKKMSDANKKGIELREKGKNFEAAVAFMEAHKWVLDEPQNEKTVRENVQLALNDCSPDELSRIAIVAESPESIKTQFDGSTSTVPPTGRPANGTPAPGASAPTPGSSANGDTPARPSTKEDLERARKKIMQRLQGTGDFDGRDKTKE